MYGGRSKRSLYLFVYKIAYVAFQYIISGIYYIIWVYAPRNAVKLPKSLRFIETIFFEFFFCTECWVIIRTFLPRGWNYFKIKIFWIKKHALVNSWINWTCWILVILGLWPQLALKICPWAIIFLSYLIAIDQRNISYSQTVLELQPEP